MGVLAFGGCAVGVYAMGGLALGQQIACGGYASAPVAIGDQVDGAAEFYIKNGLPQFSPEEVRQAIISRFPNTWKVIVDLFVRVSSW